MVITFLPQLAFKCLLHIILLENFHLLPQGTKSLNQLSVLLPSACSPVAKILLSCAIYLKSQVTQREQNE